MRCVIITIDQPIYTHMLNVYSDKWRKVLQQLSTSGLSGQLISETIDNLSQ